MSNSLKANLLLITGCILWGLSFPAIKVAVFEFDIFGVIFLRLLIAVLLFFLFYAIRRKHLVKLRKKDIKWFLFLGLLFSVFYHLLLNYAETIVGASLASIIIALMPAFTVIFARLILNERLKKSQIIGIVIAIVGTYIIMLASYKEESANLVGFIALIISVFAWTFNTIYSKKLLDYYDSLSFSFYSMLFGLLLLAPFSVLWDWGKIVKASSEGIISIVFLGVIASFLAMFLWFYGLKYKKSGETTSYLLIMPLVSCLFSYIYLDEKITLITILGGILIISGVFVANKKARNRQRKKKNEERVSI